jgi:hypothetical protein
VRTTTGNVSPLWLTEDGGATWAAVNLPESGSVSGTTAGVRAIGWQEQSGRWYAVGAVDPGSTDQAAFWYGATATDGVGYMPTGADLYRDVKWTQSGMGGDMLFSEDDSPGLGTRGRLTRVPNDGTVWTGETWKTNAITGWEQPFGPLDTIRGTREFWQVNLGATPGLAHWTDYRTTDPASDTGGAETRPNDVNGAYQYVAVADTHVFFASNVAAHVGFYRRTHASWTPSGSPEYAVSGTVYLATTDRQSRRLFIGYADISGTHQFITHDGAVWTAVQFPDAALESAHSGYGALWKDPRGCAYAPLGEVSTG